MMKITEAKAEVARWQNSIRSWQDVLRKRQQELQKDADKAPDCSSECPDGELFIVHFSLLFHPTSLHVYIQTSAGDERRIILNKHCNFIIGPFSGKSAKSTNT